MEEEKIIKTAKEIAEEKLKSEEEKKPEYKPDALPQIDFTTFVLLLSATGMQHLGKIANPLTNKIERDLIQAKQTIDLLAMLEEKTKGNLTKEEDEILRTTLTNLRLNYVDEVKKE